eukprot:2558769-Pyramimonas_sp.AAC.1
MGHQLPGGAASRCQALGPMALCCQKANYEEGPEVEEHQAAAGPQFPGLGRPQVSAAAGAGC